MTKTPVNDLDFFIRSRLEGMLHSFNKQGAERLWHVDSFAIHNISDDDLQEIYKYLSPNKCSGKNVIIIEYYKEIIATLEFSVLVKFHKSHPILAVKDDKLIIEYVNCTEPANSLSFKLMAEPNPIIYEKMKSDRIRTLSENRERFIKMMAEENNTNKDRLLNYILTCDL